MSDPHDPEKMTPEELQTAEAAARSRVTHGQEGENLDDLTLDVLTQREKVARERLRATDPSNRDPGVEWEAQGLGFSEMVAAAIHTERRRTEAVSARVAQLEARVADVEETLRRLSPDGTHA